MMNYTSMYTKVKKDSKQRWRQLQVFMVREMKPSPSACKIMSGLE